jgi:hypothetical protein
VVFPLWLRWIGKFIYRDSGWSRLAAFYRISPARGKYERLPRLVIGGTHVNGCKIRRDGDLVILQMGFPFRWFVPHPPLGIPVSRIKMKGRNRGTIGIQGGGVPFEGFDVRKLS